MNYSIIHKLFFIILSLVVFTSCKQTETGDIILSNINVVDVENGVVIKNQDVIINGNKIQKILPYNEVNIESNQIVDGTNRYLIPGLWDMHTHIRSYSDIDNLPMFIMYGVTGIRDLGITNHELIKHWKEQIENNDIVGPRIISSGIIIEGAGAYFPSSIVINELDDVKPTLDSLFAQDAQVVKLFDNIPVEVFKAIIRYSKEKGIVTSGHIPNDMDQISAAEAGLGSIEHLFGIENTLSNYNDFSFTDEEIEKLAKVLIENETYQSPTMVDLGYYVKLGEASKNEKLEKALFETNPHLELTPVYFKAWWAANRNKDMENFTEEDYANFKKRLAINGKIINKLHDLGVKILAGTDVPNPYIITGISLHEELEQFVNAGMSPADALKTATLYPAQYFKHSEIFGLVDVNYMADLVVLDANPLEDISNTQRIHAVIYNGQLHTEENLDDLKSNQLAYLAEYSVTDFDQFIYMDVRRNGIENIRKKYPIVETNDKYAIEKYHLVRLSKALQEGLQLEDAIRALEWNLELFPEDEITKTLLSGLLNQ